VLSAFFGSSSIGYFNAATYFWPRYRKLREKKHPTENVFQICCQNNCKSNDYTKDRHDSVIYTERANFMVEEEKREEELEDTSAVDATTPTP
jgi:K+-transporting ATPase c subunit